MAATIMGDAAIAMGGEEEHLIFKGALSMSPRSPAISAATAVGAERPAMAEDDRLSGREASRHEEVIEIEVRRYEGPLTCDAGVSSAMII
jgi:hypothetical protein